MIDMAKWKPIIDEARALNQESAFKGRVYIAGPLTTKKEGGVKKCIADAAEVARKILNLGYTVYVPHFSFYIDQTENDSQIKECVRDYEYWIRTCLDWLKICDIVFRMEGESLGADIEVGFALKMGMPVLHGIETFNEVPNWLLRSKRGKGVVFKGTTKTIYANKLTALINHRKEEDKIIEEMDELWYKLSEKEREEMNEINHLVQIIKKIQ